MNQCGCRCIRLGLQQLIRRLDSICTHVAGCLLCLTSASKIIGTLFTNRKHKKQAKSTREVCLPAKSLCELLFRVFRVYICWAFFSNSCFVSLSFSVHLANFSCESAMYPVVSTNKGVTSTPPMWASSAATEHHAMWTFVAQVTLIPHRLKLVSNTAKEGTIRWYMSSSTSVYLSEHHVVTLYFGFPRLGWAMMGWCKLVHHGQWTLTTLIPTTQGKVINWQNEGLSRCPVCPFNYKELACELASTSALVWPSSKHLPA